MTARPFKRQPADVLCAICGRPVAECTVGGLHGQIRDKAAKATREMRANGTLKVR